MSEGRNFFSSKQHSKKYFLKHAFNRNCKQGDKYLDNYFLGMAILVSSLAVLTAELNLQHSHFKIENSLKLSGDVELNPRLSEMKRSFQGSLNQGNVALFGKITGRQCACNALFFSICWSVICDIWYWKFVDLDYLLVDGDKLCKSLKCHDYLNVDWLPRRTVNLDLLEENLYDSKAIYGDSFLTDVFTVSNKNTSSGCILFFV